MHARTLGSFLFSISTLFICSTTYGQLNFLQSSFSNTGLQSSVLQSTIAENDQLYQWCNWQLNNLPSPSINPAFSQMSCMQLRTLQKICDLQLQKYVDVTEMVLPKPMEQQLLFQKANTLFLQKKYYLAIADYNKIQNTSLSNLQIVEKNFNLAFSYLSTNQEKEVIPLMASVVNIRGNYFESGNYYFGLLNFYNGKYTDALSSFEKIQDDKEFKKVVPYYIAAIHYFNGNKEKSLQIAEKYLNDEDAKIYFRDELNLLAGQIYFENKNYKQAIPYIENYIAETSNIRREDLFLLGFANYQIGNIVKAQDVLNRIPDDLDTVSQMSNFVLADCFMKQGNKEDAKDAFQKVLNIDGNATINEVSRYHFASLSYEMHIDDDALNAAYNLVKKFPNSIYKGDCMKMLGNLLTTTENHEAALQLLRELNTPEVKAAHQKKAFNQAMVELKNKSTDKALALLQESDANLVDDDIKAYSDFWKADIYYNQKNYAKSSENADLFLQSVKKEKGDINKNNAYLLKIYIAIKQGDDTNAIKNINKIFSSKNDNYLFSHAIELNKLNKTIENYKSIEIKNTELIKAIAVMLDNYAQELPNVILKLDSLVNLKDYQIALIKENKVIYQALLGNHQNALPELMQINTTNNPRLHFYALQSAVALKDSNVLMQIATNALHNIDTTNEWQAKIVMQLLDAAIAQKNTTKAEMYLNLLKRFITLPYAKTRIPIKQKLLKTMLAEMQKAVLPKMSIPKLEIDSIGTGPMLVETIKQPVEKIVKDTLVNRVATKPQPTMKDKKETATKPNKAIIKKENSTSPKKAKK
jgi:TolA-binding protein